MLDRALKYSLTRGVNLRMAILLKQITVEFIKAATFTISDDDFLINDPLTMIAPNIKVNIRVYTSNMSKKNCSKANDENRQ